MYIWLFFKRMATRNSVRLQVRWSLCRWYSRHEAATCNDRSAEPRLGPESRWKHHRRQGINKEFNLKKDFILKDLNCNCINLKLVNRVVDWRQMETQRQLRMESVLHRRRNVCRFRSRSWRDRRHRGQGSAFRILDRSFCCQTQQGRRKFLIWSS